MAAMASRAFPVTPEIAIEDLIQGDNYRIEHRHGDWPPKTGKFSGLRTDYPKCAYFNLDEPHVPKVHVFCTNDYTFHDTYSESINMISKSKSLPNNVGKYLKKFGGSMKKTKRSRRTRRRTRRQTRRR